MHSQCYQMHRRGEDMISLVMRIHNLNYIGTIMTTLEDLKVSHHPRPTKHKIFIYLLHDES